MSEIKHALGLRFAGPFHRDRAFWAALWVGVGFWAALWWWVPVDPITPRQAVSWAFVSVAIWQPLAEELIFRGFLQGQLRHYAWGRRSAMGVSLANAATTAVFVLGHLWQHAPLWAFAVTAPSLLFGWFRDRYDSVYPALVLHMFYNAGYFALTGLPSA